MSSSTLVITLTLVFNHVFECTEMGIIFPCGLSSDSELLASERISVTDTEKKLEKMFDRRVNITRLSIEYSLICPIRHACGTGLDPSFFYDGPDNYKEFKDCPECTCEWSCQNDGTCCPYCYHGYIESECIEGQVYPKNGSRIFLPMIAKCARKYANSSFSYTCQNEMQPCTVPGSRTIYKNKHCAECNEETEACIELPLKTECMYGQNTEPFKSLEEIIEFVDTYGCRVVYYAEDTPECKPQTKTRIAKCNITGLWTEYDADIEWACENFITPYGKFKNVYCYICNPSLSNKLTTPPLSQCPNTTYPQIPKRLSEACENLPEIDRMFPYKNVYCSACYGNDMDSVYDLDTGKLVFESEDIDVVSLHSDIQFSIRIFGFSIDDQLLQLLENYLRNFWPVSDSHLLQQTSDTYLSSYTEEIMKDYQAVCGIPSPCVSRNTSSSFLRGYSNMACEDSTCSCEDACIPKYTCCPEFLLKNNPYATLTCTLNIANVIKTDNASKFSPKSMKCNEYDNRSNSIFIIKTCPTNAQNETNRYKCESMDIDSDILKYIPISDGSKIAYRNIYCLFCNNANSRSLTSATVSLRLKCDAFLEVKLVNNLGHLIDLVNLYCGRFVYFPTSVLSGFNTDKESYNGSITYIPNKRLTDTYLPYSKLYFFTECNKTGLWRMPEDRIRRTCEGTSESVLALKPYKTVTSIYKNFACFICNSWITVSTENVVSDCAAFSEFDQYKTELCNRTERHPVWAPYKNFYCADCNYNYQPLTLIMNGRFITAQLYKYIFSISKAEFSQALSLSRSDPVTEPECADGVFDTESGLCQKYYCFDDFVLVKDICTSPIKSQSNELYPMQLLLQYDGTKAMTADRIMVDLNQLGKLLMNEISTSLNPGTKHIIEDFYFKTPDGCIGSQSRVLSDKSVDIKMVKKLLVQIAVKISYSANILLDRLALVQFTKMSTIQLYQGNNEQSVIRFRNNIVELTEAVKTYKFCTVVFSNYTRDEPKSGIKPVIHDVNEFLYCPMIRINIADVFISPLTQRLFTTSGEWSFESYMYRTVGNFVYVCAKYIEKKHTESGTKQPFLEEALNTTTLVCTLLSITCLVLTFFTYYIFPKLREKVIGKSNIILCLMLSMAQALVQFGIERYESRSTCVAIGVLIHYFLIGAFCTMNVCAFNMFKIFYINRNILDTRVKFRKYFIFILGVPFILVSSVVIFNLFKSNGSDIGYGKTFCFISYFEEMMTLFFLPSVTLFLANACFFALAFYAIRSSPAISNKQDKRDFVLYVKLSSVIGLAWPLLIADNLIGLTWFSFITSGLNALQGVFIFFSYAFNKRVGLMYRNLMSGTNTTT